MLGDWRSHMEYQQFVVRELAPYAHFDSRILYEREEEITALFHLNLDLMRPVVALLYSPTGRPAKYQPEFFRTFVLMSRLKEPMDRWPSLLKKSPLLRIIAGFPEGYVPGIASFYDFIDRIFPLSERPAERLPKRKPKKKLAKGEKLPPRHPGIVAKLVEKILAGRAFSQRPERTLQEIFSRVCVDESVRIGVLDPVLTISGDGTCLSTGASPYGRKTCRCKESGIYHCDCPRRFSDPSASWGWDSHNECYFYGHTGYFLSTYHSTTKTDLPVYLRLVDAKRHDSVSALVALTEFRELCPGIRIETFLSDSASDNMPTYELLEAWGINAVIALNGNRGQKPSLPLPTGVTQKGVPLCPAGHEMACDGTFRKGGRIRTKWRCPRKVRKRSPGEACLHCSPSPYGRTIYTSSELDIRMFPAIPRHSKQWKLKMNERTAAERINNRLLNHYEMDHTRQRGKKRISFFFTLAAMNLQLDAQIAKLKADGLFSFEGTFGLTRAA